MTRVDKVIAFNATAMRAKYSSSAWKRIQAALKKLVAADASRGVTAQLVAVDRKTTMGKLGARHVVNVSNRRQHKVAVDDLYATLEPAYLLIIGSNDAFPHQTLRNPLNGPDADEDAVVPSDLPYACDARYSITAQHFVGPTRVVGRVPDIEGSGDPRYLLRLLQSAREWRSRPRAEYEQYFGLTAKVWKQSTATSLRKVFGSYRDLLHAPPKGPPWSKSLLSRLAHFINCHGAPMDQYFYGEHDGQYPRCHDASQLSHVAPGAVAAAECCYGAQLYDPYSVGSHRPICNEYLARGAFGFLGSTTIAYGPAQGSGHADILCIEFMRAVLNGASLGRALLTARQKYMAGQLDGDPVSLKTLAQFNLLGDPSIHPVAPSAGAAPKKARASSKNAKATADPAAATARRQRRRRLSARGTKLKDRVRPTEARPPMRSPRTVKGQLGQLAKKLDATTMLTFDVRPSPSDATLPSSTPQSGVVEKAAAKQGPAPGLGSYHVLFGAKTAPRGPRIASRTIVVVHEVGGEVAELVELHQR